MPDPKTCAAKFKVGSKEYKDCIAYKGQAKPVKGRTRKPQKSGY
tara:strand:- start:199 stop:330 length:132 start_codon:yes stop_codon:yes gene_type:complete